MKKEEIKEENYVVGYKGLKNDLSSSYNHDLKYELNKRYKLNSENQELKLCDTGFHFCRNKQDVFDFYNIDGINNYRYFEIRAYGNIIDDEYLNENGIPKKSVTDEIEIVKEIPIQEFISFPDVNYVKINNKIPENLDLSACKNLKSLYIWDCDSLKNLPKNLESLYIWNCRSLENLPENIDLSTCKNLESLKIYNCNSLENLPENLPRNLKSLEIYNCNSLKSIPENLPKNLKTLEIDYCDSLENLPEKLPENLETIKIRDCKNLKSIPENLPKNLKSLEISYCKNLKDQYWNKSE